MLLRRLLTLVLAAVVCAGCTGSIGATIAPPRRPLRMAWSLWPGWYPMVIAQQLDLFTKHGAAIEPVFYESYPATTFQDFAAGQVDGMLAGLYEVLKADIPDMRVVLVTDHSDGAEGLVVTQDIETPADLVGKRVGTQGASGELVTLTLLRSNGLSPIDVLMVDVASDQVAEQLQAHIQAGYTWDPYLSQARALGYRVLFSTADMPGLVPDVAVFHGQAARERAQDVRGFVAAWFEAQQYWLEHPAEGDAMIAQATGLSLEEISLSGCKLFGREENRRAFTPGTDRSSLFYTGQLQIDFSISLGDLNRAPDLNQMLDASFLP